MELGVDPYKVQLDAIPILEELLYTPMECSVSHDASKNRIFSGSYSSEEDIVAEACGSSAGGMIYSWPSITMIGEQWLPAVEVPPDPPDALTAISSMQMECDVPTVGTRSTISYRDMVKGSTVPAPEDHDAAFDRDDIELLEEDISHRVSDGIPTVDFSDRFQRFAIKSMDLTLVVKVLGRWVGYNTLHNRIYIKFSGNKDYLKVLTEGLWTIFGHYLTVEPWFEDFQPFQSHPRRLMAWIRLSGLPIMLYKRSLIEAIGNQIGSVVKMDFQTDNGCRGRFVRMAMNINLLRPLVSKIIINGRVQIVEYESMSMVCFHCGIYGHHKDLCPRLCSPEATSAAIATSVSMANGLEITVPADPYGPWMLVEHSLSDKNVNSALQESALELFPENHARVDVISTQLDQPILVQQIMPIINGPNTKSPADNSIQRKKTVVINKKVAVTPLGPKKTGSLAVKSSEIQMSLGLLLIKLLAPSNFRIHSELKLRNPNQGLREINLTYLWNYLRHLSHHITKPWAVIGDFNATLTMEDRKGCSNSSASDHDFIVTLFDAGLHDLGYQGPDFTWYRGNCVVPLDRCICNDHWLESFPETTIHHLLRMKSDHRPLLLQLGQPIHRRAHRQFRYFSGWLQHADFNILVVENWDSSLPLAETIHRFNDVTIIWNKNVFGSIYQRKRSLMARLRGVQRRLDQRRFAFLTHLESKLLLDLEQTLDQEELLWKQKSRSEWVKFGDRNTAFFHKRAIIHKRALRVTSLQLELGDWCYDEDALHDEAVSFFQKLFTIDTSESIVCPLTCCFPHVPSDEMQKLSCIHEPLEIKEAIFSMLPLKSPGPDGLHAHFFQKNWHIVGNSVCSMVQHVFASSDIDHELNLTTLVLIPKVQSPSCFKYFRPISLCSVLYKLITKILVQRLQPIMPKLIAPNQTSFISGRNISENVIINKEVFHSMKSKKGRHGWMVLKVNLEKSFDRLHWNFIADTLREAHFSPSVIHLISRCISTSTLRIQLNGLLSRPFKPERGIHQGDPISTYIFVLTMECLGHCIQQAVNNGLWEPFQLVQEGLSISHLFFADDLMLYAKETMAQAKLIDKILSDFGIYSRHKLNKLKSQVFFKVNTGNSAISLVSARLGMQHVDDISTYLGLPGWSARHLSFAGKVALANAVLLAIPTYYMQTCRLSSRVCEDIERLVRSFIWGTSTQHHVVSFVNWDALSQPRVHVGLGIQNFQNHNVALLMKIC
ncbi:hypothetical protein GQ457_12G017420 [Hibiscus cannabinus]